MNLVDIAVNLTSPAFDQDRAEVLARARAADVTALIIPGSTLEDSARAIDLAQGNEGCAATAGVHPHNAKDWDAESSPERLRELALRGTPGNGSTSDRIVAIGECGLDYNRNFSPQDAQQKCFEDQLALAAQLGKPAFLHERDAFDDFLPILKRHRADLPGAVVHCFTGGEKELEAYLALDCHIGITGWICDERRGTHLIPLVRQIPADRLLLETDAPYLLPRNLPKALRKKGSRSGGRNEPSFLPHIAAFVAEIVGKTAEQLAKETSANALRLFNLPESLS